MSLLQQVEECIPVDDERLWSTYPQKNIETNGLINWMMVVMVAIALNCTGT